jgi:hypothetical protein
MVDVSTEIEMGVPRETVAAYAIDPDNVKAILESGAPRSIPNAC